MKINVDVSHARYPKIFVAIAYIAQIIAVSGLFMANGYYEYGVIYFMLSAYLFSVSSLWLYVSYPEVRIHFITFNIIFIPYFLCQFFSFLMVIPFLTYFFLYLCFKLIEPNYLFALNIFINGLALAVFALVSYALFYFPKQLQFNEIKLKHPNPKLRNYRIIHLSDLHISNFITQNFLKKICQKVNQSNADLIVITGDLLSFGDHFMDDAIAFISKLHAKDAIIFSLGNHDYYVDTAQLIIKLKSIGCVVLCTELYANERFSVGAISGVINDRSKGKEELDEILKKNQNNPPDILLAHDPIIFEESYRQKVPLTLSGHTHGGQIKIPFINFNLAYFDKHEHLAGLYSKLDSYLYVHKGIGMSGLPFRLGVSPEVVLFTLE